MLAAVATLALQFASPLPPGVTLAQRQILAMGTILRGSVEAHTRDAAEAALEAASFEIERWDRLLSTWDPSTPMSSANRSPVGNPAPLPTSLTSVLAEAQAWSARTNGSFDPVVGALVDLWDLRGEGRIPEPDALSAALTSTGAAAVRIDGEASTMTRMTPDAWIDTGAFGKGAALRAAADTLRRRGVTRGFLDLGGQLLILGSDPDPVPVGVAHPIHRDRTSAALRLGPGWSVATSGNSERGITVGGARLGHLLDPKTGLPATDWGSVTVVSEDAMVADILSTALYVMGPKAGLAWAEARDDVGALFLVVTADGGLQTLSNQAMQRWLAPPGSGAGAPTTSTPERRFP